MLGYDGQCSVSFGEVMLAEFETCRRTVKHVAIC
jgi:hypothetical protein